MLDLPRLLEPEDLLPLLGRSDLLIIDLSKQAVHQEAHIPGAIFVPFQTLVHGQPPATGHLPEGERLSQLFAWIGLHPDLHVVAYDDEGGGWAGRFLWTLDLIGHTRWSYLNGGLVAWLQAGLPTEDTQHQPASRAAYVHELDRRHLADIDDLLQAIERQDTELVIWDARSPEEFHGQRQFAQRAGHIPGAINYEWTRAMDRERGLRLRPLEELRAELAALGISADKDIVTHCHTHHRSGLTWLIGRLLGFPRLRAYAGSWSEWGNHRHTPIETPDPRG